MYPILITITVRNSNEGVDKGYSINSTKGRHWPIGKSVAVVGEGCSPRLILADSDKPPLP